MINALSNVLAWFSRNWLRIILVCAVVAVLSTLRACNEGGKVSEAIEQYPVLPKKAAKQIIARAKADSVKADTYKRIATVAIQQKDSALTIARTKTAQADSIHAEITALPAAAGGPLSAVRLRLTTYQGADTTGF